MFSFQSRVLKSTLKYSIKSLSSGGGKESAAEAALSRAAKKSQIRPRHDWESVWRRLVMETKLKVRQNETPLMVCLLFWLSGLVYYSRFEPLPPQHQEVTWRWYLQVLFVSLAIRTPSPESQSDLSKFYELCWPIFLEVVVFGLVATSMMSAFNPVLVAQMTAENHSNHTVVIGYEHLGEKIVDHLRETNRPYVLVEESIERAAPLVKVFEPVVVGNPTDMSTLSSAQVAHCKEVFVVLNNLHNAIVVCFQIRAINKACRLYVQVFENEEFKDYFAKDPLKAFAGKSSPPPANTTNLPFVPRLTNSSKHHSSFILLSSFNFKVGTGLSPWLDLRRYCQLSKEKNTRASQVGLKAKAGATALCDPSSRRILLSAGSFQEGTIKSPVPDCPARS